MWRVKEPLLTERDHLEDTLSRMSGPLSSDHIPGARAEGTSGEQWTISIEELGLYWRILRDVLPINSKGIHQIDMRTW